MNINISELKKKSKSNFDRLLKEVDKLNTPTYDRDNTVDNYWKPTQDKAGNALAVIRFLPGAPIDGADALPWVQYWDHGFQNKVTGKWYIEKSLTTLGQKDPVSEYNSTLWGASGDDNSPERKQARDQKRRLHFVSNIYVVSDPKNPSNEGKVFLYKYGKKIHDKILKMMNPDLESEQKINPFDIWQGANFKLKMTRQSGFPNYDESVFLTPGPLSDDDKEITEVLKSEHSLLEINNPKSFKTYNELKARLDDVLGFTAGAARVATATVSKVVEEAPWQEDKPVAKKATKTPVVEDDDEDLAMFRELADLDD